MKQTMRRKDNDRVARRLALLLAAGCLALALPAGAADRVGYINISQLVRDSQMGKEARAELEATRRQKEQAVEIKGRTLKLLREELNTAGAQMGEVEKRQKIDALQKIYKEYQRLVADAKDEILQQDRDLVARILKQADGVLKEVARKQKFAIILKDPNAIGYLDPEADITQAVLDALDKK